MGEVLVSSQVLATGQGVCTRMNAILIIMISLTSGNIHHVKHIDKGYLSMQECMQKRHELQKTWMVRSDLEHLDIRCMIKYET
jgi:hypothetical protein